jgi:two-component system, chemotaxis family, protein-glutamate methylesterase/glutaminase
MANSIVVIGGSAGAVEALTRIVANLPADLPAAVFVAVHFPPHGNSALPAILERAGRLPARHPESEEPIREGTILVAPPDHHLLLARDHVRLSRGPRENGHRPAVDPLFRTAARAHGARVIGVLLSGNLDDGSAGLAAVRSMGGRVVVQDPADARHSGMPRNALQAVQADHVAGQDDIGPLIERLVRQHPPAIMKDASDRLDNEAGMAELRPDVLMEDERPGRPSPYSCPECSGVLWEMEEGGLVRYRCRVGHAYGAESLLAEQTDAVEAALWTALKALKEQAVLARRLASRMVERGNQRSASSFASQADDTDRMARTIADVLRSGSYAAWTDAASGGTSEPGSAPDDRRTA